MTVLSIGYCIGIKVVVESRYPIKLNFGDKTRTRGGMAYQWHTFDAKNTPLLSKSINACIFSCVYIQYTTHSIFATGIYDDVKFYELCTKCACIQM